MDLELRPVSAEELAAFTRVEYATFGETVTDEQIDDVRLVAEPDRTVAAFERGAIVATAAAFSFQLTLPGGARVPAAGVTAVGVLPSHRRRGLLTALMERQLADVADRGEPVAVLTASEAAIYGRFGYGLATFASHWRLATEGTVLARPSSAGGRVRLIDAGEAAAVLPSVRDRAVRRHPGQLGWPERWWRYWLLDRERDRDGASARFYAVHQTAEGQADGYVAYRVKGGWSHGLPDKELVVEQLLAVDDEVEAALWQLVMDHDLVATVVAPGRPPDEPLRWRLADPRRLVTADVVDHLWVRPVDPAAALAARTYGTDDRLVLEVSDPFRPATEGRYVVEGGPEGASAAATAAEADVALAVGDLGSLLLGGISATTLARAGRVRELRPGALRRAGAFFAAGAAPWCDTDF